jgi:hypothetical protein
MNIVSRFCFCLGSSPATPTAWQSGVTHATGLGGISFPAMLIGTDEDCTTAELDAYRH